MNLKKTRLWLALTGWLPWACYFGVHVHKTVAKGHMYIYLPSQRSGDLVVPMALGRAYYVPRLCVCKRCGVAW